MVLMEKLKAKSIIPTTSAMSREAINTTTELPCNSDQVGQETFVFSSS
jgi:hypothetical protein